MAGNINDVGDNLTAKEKHWFSLTSGDDLKQQGTSVNDSVLDKLERMDRESEPENISQDEMVDLASQSNSDLKSYMKREPLNDSSGVPVFQKSIESAENEQLISTKINEQQWFTLEASKPSEECYAEETAADDHQNQIKSSNRKSPATNETDSGNLMFPVVNSSRQAEVHDHAENDNFVENVTEPETGSLVEDVGLMSDVTDRSLASNSSYLNAKSGNEQPLQEKMNNIAGMQRPEPLGKARAENEIKQLKDSNMAGFTTLKERKRSIDANLKNIEGHHHTMTTKSANKNSSTENSSSDERPSILKEVSHLEETASDTGLNEQEYPVRVPLSLSEGYNHLSKESQFTYVHSKDSHCDDGSYQHDTIADNRSVNESLEEMNLIRKKTSEITTESSDSNPLYAADINMKTNINDGKHTNPSHAVVESYPEALVPVSDAATPISKLLGPSYKSSVILLEELRRRKFRKAEYEIGSSNGFDKYRKPHISNPNSHDNVDPMQLAENAMKASKILSNRTEKSIKRATEVLEAVKEQRTPPINSPESMLLSSMEDSIKAKFREISLSSVTIDASIGSSKSSEGAKDEKDSIDRLIEERLQKQGGSSTSSSLSALWPDQQSHVKIAKDDYFKGAMGKSITSDSDSASSNSFNSKPVYAELAQSSGHVALKMLASSSKTESSLDDMTSSELLRLKSFGNETESSYYNSNLSKVMTAKLLKDISPIEQPSIKPAAREIGFRSSSRIDKYASSSLWKQNNFSDSEIVRLHRSLGAGTVTPLPEVSFEKADKTEQDKTKNKNIPLSLSSISSSGAQDTTEDIKNKHEIGSDSAKNDIGENISTNRFLPSASETTSSYSDNSGLSFVEPSTELSKVRQSSELLDTQHKNLLNKPHSVQKPNGSKQNGDTRKPYSAVRGIYDIRDSSGPGSSNRKRQSVGKELLKRKERPKDPLTVYVSEQSKSSFASSKYLDNVEPDIHMGSERKREAPTSKIYQGDRNNVTNSTFSSMSSQSPYLSYSDSNVSKDLVIGYHSDRGIGSDSELMDREMKGKPANYRTNAMASDNIDKEKQDTLENDDELNLIHRVKTNTDVSRKDGPLRGTDSRSFVTPQQHFKGSDKKNSPFPYKPSSVRFAWTDEKNPTVIKRPSDFNNLWQKFQERFEPKITSRNGDVFEKIGVLSEIINDQGISAKRPLSTDVIKTKLGSPEDKRQNEELLREKVKTKNTEIVTTACCHCKKRDIGTNCPTPVPFQSELDKLDISRPLLLHTWTQTNPTNTIWHTDESRNKIIPTTEIISPKAFKHTSSANKENIHGYANIVPPKVTEIKSKSAPSWSVTFKEKHAKEQSSKHSEKPPIYPLSKKDLQADGYHTKKQREPIFTAWFQSTRSDTSSGTVVPLSEVPKLASSYKDKMPSTKIYIEETRPKETESVVRVGLQEAFKFAKEDFIRRSKERVENVKSVRTHAKQKKNLKNLKERHLEEAVVRNQPTFGRSNKSDRLFKPKKRQIDKKEMREQNRKMYEKLPEVIKKREEDERKAQYASNRIRLQQFDRKLRTRLLKSKNL